jgi:hypothetical protein
MAKLHEEVIVLKISKLLKDKDDASQILADNEVLTALEQVATELLGGGVMIEFERA